MSVGMVTARSHGGLRVANISRPPTSARVQALRPTRVLRTRIPAAVSTRAATTVVQRVATLKIAKLVVGQVLKSTPLTIAASEVGYYLFNKVVEPAGFPGFDAITAGWRKPLYTGAIGSYAPNSFDHGAFNNPPESLLDTNDIVNFTIRYWGDFGTNPYPNAVPGINWPLVPVIYPMSPPVPTPAQIPRVYPRYRPQRDLSPRTRTRPRWRPNNNIAITIRIPGPSRRVGSDVTIRNNLPRMRARDDKAKPANQFVYAVLKGLANTMGETKEWIDILAEAAGYKPGIEGFPLSVWGGNQTAAKAAWLFYADGINGIDWGLLQQLVRENEVEDFLIGIAGRMSKSAARSLGLTVGPQTGLVM